MAEKVMYHVATKIPPRRTTPLVTPLVQPGLFAHKYYSTTHDDAEEHWSYKGPHKTIVRREPAAEDTEIRRNNHFTVYALSAWVMQTHVVMYIRCIHVHTHIRTHTHAHTQHAHKHPTHTYHPRLFPLTTTHCCWSQCSSSSFWQAWQ